MQLRRTMFAWLRYGPFEPCSRIAVGPDRTIWAAQGVFKMLREDFEYQPTVKVRGQMCGSNPFAAVDG